MEQDGQSLQNRPAVEELAMQAIAIHPRPTRSFHLRSQAHQPPGRSNEARRDTVAVTPDEPTVLRH